MFLNNKISWSLIFTSISLFLVTFFWNKISFKFENPYEIVGQYSEFKHNVHNDTVRYLLFIIIPFFSFFTPYILDKEKKYNITDFQNIFLIKNNDNLKSKIDIQFLFFIYLITAVLYLYFQLYIGSFDVFEEGMPLSGGINFEFGRMPWSSLYLNTGLFYDVLNAKIAWFIFGKKSIAAFKIYIILLNLLALLLLLYLSLIIAERFIINSNLKIFFFTIVVSIVIIVNVKNNYLFREIPLILFLIVSSAYLDNQKTIYLIILSVLSFFSFMWSLDVGFYYNICNTLFVILLFANNKKKFFLKAFLLIIFWTLGIGVIGVNSFKSFIFHAGEIFSQHEMLNGIIFPKPFSNEAHSSRATKALMLILFNSIIVICFSFSKVKIFSKNTQIIFILFAFMNFIKFKTALSRSDGGHILVASNFTITLFLIFFTFFIFNFFKKKNLNFFSKLNSYIIALPFLITAFYPLYGSLVSIKNRYFNISNNIVSDKNLISYNYLNLTKEIDQILNKHECLQSFTYDLGIYYLAKRKSCSSFFNVWTIGSKKNQIKYIEEIESEKPKFILTGGSIFFQDLYIRYPYIKKYLDEKYKPYKKLYRWVFLKRKN